MLPDTGRALYLVSDGSLRRSIGVVIYCDRAPLGRPGGRLHARSQLGGRGLAMAKILYSALCT